MKLEVVIRGENPQKSKRQMRRGAIHKKRTFSEKKEGTRRLAKSNLTLGWLEWSLAKKKTTKTAQQYERRDFVSYHSGKMINDKR